MRLDQITVDELVRWEEGSMEPEEALAFFGKVIRTGAYQQLQGHYGRTAQHFVESGLLSPEGEVQHEALDAYLAEVE